MQESKSEVTRNLGNHPVLRVVKVLTFIALAVIAFAFTMFVIRFADQIDSKASNPEAPAATAPQAPSPQ